MKLPKALKNMSCLSWGYFFVSTIQSALFEYTEISNTAWDCTKGPIIFGIAFVICIIIAPSYLTLSGTRGTLYTSYICHIFYICSYYFLTHSKLMYAAYAVFGLGAALFIVAQGQCLTENSNSRTIHRNFRFFWIAYQILQIYIVLLLAVVSHRVTENNISHRVYDDYVSKYLPMSPAPWTCIVIRLIMIIANIIIFRVSLPDPPEKYSSGGLECIPNEKVMKSQEPIEGPFFAAWKPLKDLFQLVFSSKMLLLSLVLVFAGLMRSLRYNKYTNVLINDWNDILYVLIGEIIGALFTAFCICNKNNDSTMIVFMGFMMITASFSCTFINDLTNKDSFWGNPEDLSPGKRNYDRSLDMLERFSFGFGDACINIEIYSLLGALHLKNAGPAFALAGLYYWVGQASGNKYITYWTLPSQIKFFLMTGLLATIFVALIGILDLYRGSDPKAEKKSLKSKETSAEIVKVIPPEIQMLYAECNQMKEKEEIPREIPTSINIPEVEILSEK